MTYASDAGSTRGGASRRFKLGAAPEQGDWGDGDSQPPRDIKKLVLIAGLGILSWVATYVGMLELIEANMGDLPLIHKAIIGFSVAMLMTMIIWLLDQMFAPINGFTKFCYALGYVFLTIISVGFGFGFYWKVLESRSEASRSAESAISQVQGSLFAAATRLDQLQTTLVQLSAVSTEKAELERTKGTSCPNSRPGDGPRRKMRDDDAVRFAFSSDFVKARVGSVKTELSALDGDLLKIVNADPSTLDPKSGTRNEFMKGLSRKLDMTVTGFNAFRTDPQLRQLRTDLSDRAERSTFGDPKKGGFVCPDPQLQGALRGAVKAIDQIPELEKPKIAAVEGSEATIEAFRRLTATFYGMLAFKMPPSADELRELQQKAVQSVEGGAAAQAALRADEAVGLSKRDYVPLAVALFVDICLLLVSMGRPMNRLGGLVPKMREAERGPVIQILSRFNEIHRDPQVRQNFEVFRHVVFDQGGAYYVAVPLDAPYRVNPRNPDQRYGYSSSDVQELQHEAHLLANLFTSFEKERIFSRVYSPLLTTRAIQKKLERQGSKFAGCEAFRLYRFRDGAWSQIILGAVMGAARRAELQRQRKDIEQELFAAARGPDLAAVPVTAAAPHRDRTGPGRDPARDIVRREEPVTGPSLAYPRPAPDETTIDPAYLAKHGPYARAAKADVDRHEAAEAAEAAARARAANSNTMPSARRAAEPSDLAAWEREVAAQTVVTLPVRPRPAGRTPLAYAEPEQAGYADLDEPVLRSARSEPAEFETIDVVMRRETATFKIPVSQATLPGGLLPPLSTPAETAAAAPPQSIRIADQTAISEIARALEGAGDFEEETPSENLEWDHDTADAIGMAGRLRPAIPAQ
jgi:hypothetical protein